ncbi:MAG TPA: MFS transporter [Firmicutes bacterium]|nr:MFS transporter [Bacillota bacterium]
MAHIAEERASLWQRLFINRDYGLLLVGRLVSNIGDGIYYFALTWLVLDLTGSGTVLGSVLMAASLPGILLTPFAGVIVDAVSRKLIIVGADLIRGALILTVAVIYYSGQMTLSILYGATVLLSLCGVVFGPAVSATIPNLVKKEELVQANARDSLSMSATGILGPIAGAALLGAVGYAGVFVFTGISFILSGISEVFIRFPAQEQRVSAAASSSPVRQFMLNLKEGFAYVWDNVGLRTVILFALLLNFMGTPMFSVVFPYFAKQVLKLEAGHYGLIQSSFPVGVMAGTFLVGMLARKVGKHRLISWATIGQGIIALLISIIAFPVVYQQLPVLAVLASIAVPMLFLGVFNVQVNVPLNVMLQETVSDHYRGRVFGLVGSLVQMLVPISTALAGVLVDTIPTSYFLIASGIAAVVLGAAMGISPSIGSLFRHQESQHEAAISAATRCS